MSEGEGGVFPCRPHPAAPHHLLPGLQVHQGTGGGAGGGATGGRDKKVRGEIIEVVLYMYKLVVTTPAYATYSLHGIWNEYNLYPLAKNNWRASLVLAATVIPAMNFLQLHVRC